VTSNVPGKDQAADVNSHCHLRRSPTSAAAVAGHGAFSAKIPDVRSGPASVSRKGGPEPRMLSWNRKRLRILVGLLELQLIAMFTELEL
jgi:hypothetical protein